eukprot:g13374.t1
MLSVLSDAKKTAAGVVSDEREAEPRGDESDDFFSSDSDESADGADAEENDADQKKAQKRNDARSGVHVSVKTACAVIGELQELLMYLATTTSCKTKILHLFLLADKGEMLALFYVCTWIKDTIRLLRGAGFRRFKLLVHITNCKQHAQATGLEESAKLLVRYLPGTFQGNAFEKRLRLYVSGVKARLWTGLQRARRWVVRPFTSEDAREQELFEKDAYYSQLYHSFYKTQWSGLGGKFRFVRVDNESTLAPHQNKALVEFQEDCSFPAGAPAGTNAQKKTKPLSLEQRIRRGADRLFASTSWNTVAYTRWLNVVAAFISICGQGSTGIPAMDAGLTYNINDDQGEFMCFSRQEQVKLHQVCTCAYVLSVPSKRAQAATLTSEGRKDTTENEAALRRLRWESFQHGHVVSTRRLIVLPRDVEYGGGGVVSREAAQDQRDGTARAQLHLKGGMLGRVIDSRTVWEKFCDEYAEKGEKREASAEKQALVDDYAGYWQENQLKGRRGGIRSPPRNLTKRELKQAQRGEGPNTCAFLRLVSSRDWKAAIVAASINGEALADTDPAQRQQIMDGHLLFAQHVKDASVLMERYNKYPKTEGQLFKCGAAKTTESNSASAQSRHLSGVFAGARKRVKQYVTKQEGLVAKAVSEPQKSGAVDQFRFETKSRNEVLDDWDDVDSDEKERLRLACIERHQDAYYTRNTKAAGELRSLRQDGVRDEDLMALYRREQLRKQVVDFRRHLKLSRALVAEFCRASTSPYSKFVFPRDFAETVAEESLSCSYLIPSSSVLGQFIGILRENRSKANRPLKLKMPGQRTQSENPHDFDRKDAEFSILKAALRAAAQYEAGKFDDHGEVPSEAPAQTTSSSAAAPAGKTKNKNSSTSANSSTGAPPTAAKAPDKDLRAHFERLLKAAITKSEAVAKNPKMIAAARFYTKLEPFRDPRKMLVVDLVFGTSTTRSARAGSEVKESWVISWDLGKPDRAALSRAHCLPRRCGDFVRLGGVADEPHFVDLSRDTVHCAAAESFSGSAPRGEQGVSSSSASGSGAAASSSKSRTDMGEQVVSGASASLTSRVVALRLADSEWRDAEDKHFSSITQIKSCTFYLATIAVVYPVALSQSRLDRAHEFDFFDGITDELAEKMKVEEQQLSSFYPSIPDLPGRPRPQLHEFASPKIVNDPYLLLEKVEEVVPMGGNVRWPKEESEAPATAEERENAAKELDKEMIRHTKQSRNIFETNRPRGRDRAVINQVHYLRGAIHGSDEVDPEKERSLREQDELIVKEEQDDEQHLLLGVTHYDDSMEPHEVAALVGSTSDEDINAAARFVPEELDPPEDYPASGFAAADSVDGGGDAGLPINPSSRRQQLGDGTAVAGEDIDDPTDANACLEEARRQLDVVVQANIQQQLEQARVNAASGSGSKLPSASSAHADFGLSDRDLARLQELQAAHDAALRKGEVGCPSHPYWKIAEFGWRAKSEVFQQFKASGGQFVGKCLQCFPEKWSTEGARYHAVWDRFPNVAGALFLAQPSTRTATRNYRPGRLQTAKCFLMLWAWRSRFLLKHFVDRRSQPPAENEWQLLQVLFRNHMAPGLQVLKSLSETAGEKKVLAKLQAPLPDWTRLFLNWEPQFVLSTVAAAKTLAGFEAFRVIQCTDPEPMRREKHDTRQRL